MRQVGFLSNLDQAERFADYLRSLGTECSVDTVTDGFRVWVQDDDLVTSAKQELPIFLAEPNHQRYRDAAEIVKAKRKEKQSRLDASRSNIVNVSDSWNPSVAQKCPVTLGLIVISIFVAYMTGLKPVRSDPFAFRLFFSTDATFKQILAGEIWRTITPIFLHFSPMHIAFNLLMTYQLGLQIEPRRGTFKFLSMVLLIAVFSNLGQFVFQKGELHGGHMVYPLFGGMSGVVYGLFGYTWIKGRLDPRSGFGLPPESVFMMLGWFIVCTVELVPHVANWAHGVGLATGMILAAGETLVRSILRRR